MVKIEGEGEGDDIVSSVGRRGRERGEAGFR